MRLVALREPSTLIRDPWHPGGEGDLRAESGGGLCPCFAKGHFSPGAALQSPAFQSARRARPPVGCLFLGACIVVTPKSPDLGSGIPLGSVCLPEAADPGFAGAERSSCFSLAAAKSPATRCTRRCGKSCTGTSASAGSKPGLGGEGSGVGSRGRPPDFGAFSKVFGDGGAADQPEEL